MPDKIKLPPGATLVDDGTQGMALPPGATLAPAAQFPSTSMTDASGQLQMVPHEQLAQRMQQGWKVGPPAQQGDLSASLPEVKQANQDYSQRGAFGKAMSWTLGTLGPDAERYANKSGLAEDIQNAANNSSEQQSREASRIAATRPDGIMTRAAVGAKVLDSAVMGTVGSSMKVARAMATPVNAAAATAATLVPPLRLPIGAYYAIRGAMDTFTPQQPGESAPDAMERRLLGGASMAGGAAGAVSGFRPAVTAARGIASKVGNSTTGQVVGEYAKPLASLFPSKLKAVFEGYRGITDRINNIKNPPPPPPPPLQVMSPFENSTSNYQSFEPAAIGMADSLPPEAPPRVRVPVWRGIASGQPPVLQPEPLPPATPRTAALAQNGLPQPSPTQATAQPRFISPDEVLSHITGEGTGFELPRVIKQAPTDLSPEEIIATSKRGPIRPAVDILNERRQGGWNPESSVRPLIKANQTLNEYRLWQARNDAVNETNDPYVSPEELGWRYMQDARSPGSWAAKYPAPTSVHDVQSPATQGVNPIRGITQASASPAINEVEQAMAKSGTTAAGDNQYFQQAKDMLGPKATISEISQQAQKLKLQAQDMEGQLRRSIQQAQARRAAQ